MPYPTEHSCRIAGPSRFEPNSFRRIKNGILAIIIGKLKGQDKTSTQAFRYPISDWEEKDARKHCEDNKGSFEAAKNLEAMTVKELMDPEVNDLIPKEDTWD